MANFFIPLHCFKLPIWKNQKTYRKKGTKEMWISGNLQKTQCKEWTVLTWEKEGISSWVLPPLKITCIIWGKEWTKKQDGNWDAPTQSSSGNFLRRELIIIAKLHANYQLSMKIYRGFSHFLSWPFFLTCKGNSFKTHWQQLITETVLFTLSKNI